MNIREILAANLKRYRRERDVSQEELAHLAEINLDLHQFPGAMPVCG